MIYVFEGIEGAGKSTFAFCFAESLGLPVIKDPESGLSRTPEQWRSLGGQFNTDVAAFSRVFDFVVDRWALSSMVYDYLRGAYAGDAVHARLAAAIDARVFVIDVETDIAMERIIARDGNSRRITLDELEARRARYLDVAELWNRWGGQALVLDGTEEEALWSQVSDEAVLDGFGG